MSNEFAVLRGRIFQVVSDMVTTLEEKVEYNQYDSSMIERLAKACILLETQAGKTGKDTIFKDAPTEDLEGEFE
jgi:hypothetical protein